MLADLLTIFKGWMNPKIFTKRNITRKNCWILTRQGENDWNFIHVGLGFHTGGCYALIRRQLVENKWNSTLPSIPSTLCFFLPIHLSSPPSLSFPPLVPLVLLEQELLMMNLIISQWIQIAGCLLTREISCKRETMS